MKKKNKTIKALAVAKVCGYTVTAIYILALISFMNEQYILGMISSIVCILMGITKIIFDLIFITKALKE